MTNNRIWELDALRGLCIIGMVAVHAVYDAVELYGLIRWNYPPAFLIVKDWGAVVFLLLSGTSATLGSRSVRRGLIVLGCGLAITAVTVAGALLGLVDGGMTILFGILHCLGCCMILWHFFRRLSGKWLTGLGTILVAAGFLAGRVTVPFPWLIPLGLLPAHFSSADFFPLLPNLGYFLLGAALGRKLYPLRQTRFPNAAASPISRFFQVCGRHSLTIYMLHQPVLLLVLACFGS